MREVTEIFNQNQKKYITIWELKIFCFIPLDFFFSNPQMLVNFRD